jgi:Flp pilus assembly protein TadG
MGLFSRRHNAVTGPRRGWPGAPRRRAGIATVEFAMVATFFGIIIVGMIEISHAIYVKEILTDAGRRGANTGIKANMTYTDISNAVDDILATDKRLPATIANGKAHLVVKVATWNPTSQTYGTDTTVTSSTFAPSQYDKISVQVWVNASDVPLLFLQHMTGEVEGETVVMMKQ